MNICWISVIIFFDANDQLDALLEDLLAYNHPPGAILHMAKNLEMLNQPHLIGPTTWMESIGLNDTWYCHHSFTLSSTSTSTSSHCQYTNEDHNQNSSITLLWTITNATLIHHNLIFSLPEVQELNVHGQQYNDTLIRLAHSAINMQQNDPILAYSSHAVPIQCQGNVQVFYSSPCKIGSLFVDDLWWYTGQQAAFINSGGF
ncbi:hypothetical protein ACA910_010994 [Epithemia clementina (nom. ined.)]